MAAPSPPELRRMALAALQVCAPADKVQQVRVLHAAATAMERNAAPQDVDAADCDSTWTVDTEAHLSEPTGLPGRPERPRLVLPRDLPQRSPNTPEGHAALIHAVAHIEFNAINLALDAVWRFAGMPQAYYLDWLRVAGEEALHFSLLQAHLADLGWQYGDFEAHDGLWAMTHKTRHDPLARMALVPRLLEARGLDATPPMQARLRKAGDARAVEILDVILRDEVGHVAVGNRWFRWLCEREGLDPLQHFRLLARAHGAPRLKPPFNEEARQRAGFSTQEIAALHEPY